MLTTPNTPAAASRVLSYERPCDQPAHPPFSIGPVHPRTASLLSNVLFISKMHLHFPREARRITNPSLSPAAPHPTPRRDHTETPGSAQSSTRFLPWSALTGRCWKLPENWGDVDNGIRRSVNCDPRAQPRQLGTLTRIRTSAVEGTDQYFLSVCKEPALSNRRRSSLRGSRA